MTKVNQYTIVISIVVLILSCIVTGGTIKQEESDHGTNHSFILTGLIS